MKITEITDTDKSFLKLKNIEFDFTQSLELIVSTYPIIGKSIGRRTNFKNTIGDILNLIDAFLSEDFPENDLDVISANDIHNKLSEIYNQL